MLATSVVVPLLIYMLVGGLIRRLNIMQVPNFKALNNMIFKVLIPIALFFDVYRADLGDVFRADVFIFAFVALLVSYGCVWTAVSRCIDTPQQAATMIQGIHRSNFVLFGGTIAASLCGSTGQALTAALASMTVPLINMLSVITFEVKCGKDVDLKHIVISIFKNPIVDAGILGVLCHLLPFGLPGLITSPLITLGKLASPVALVTLGGILSFGSMRRHWKLLAAAVSGRLVVIPLIGVASAVLFGFRGDALIALLALFASPTAVASTPMAQAMGGDGELAGEIVALTSAVCILTIFGFVYSLSALGMI